MAREQGRQYRRETVSTRLYVDGTTVRREERRVGDQGESREAISYRVRKNREKARYMSLPYVMMLTVALAVTVMICYQYLQLRSSIAGHKHQIQNLQSSIAELKVQNNALEDGLEIYTDLDYIYKIATTELGMVYPSDEQVIQYDKTESEYVRQYEDIPTDD